MYLLAKREHIFLTYARNSGDFYTFTPNFSVIPLRTFLYFHDNKGVNEGILFLGLWAKSRVWQAKIGNKETNFFFLWTAKYIL